MNKYNILSTIELEINNWDPVKLLQMGAPQNEYDMEINMIANRIQETDDTDKIANIIYEVFIEMFEESTFSDIDKFKQECNNIAKTIYSKL